VFVCARACPEVEAYIALCSLGSLVVSCAPSDVLRLLLVDNCFFFFYNEVEEGLADE